MVLHLQKNQLDWLQNSRQVIEGNIGNIKQAILRREALSHMTGGDLIGEADYILYELPKEQTYFQFLILKATYNGWRDRALSWGVEFSEKPLLPEPTGPLSSWFN
jgi:hypothetical protein